MNLKSSTEYIKNYMIANIVIALPTVIGLIIAASLYLTVGWWGFWIIFPWIGLAISVGIYLQIKLPIEKGDLGRRIALILFYRFYSYSFQYLIMRIFNLKVWCYSFQSGFFSKE